MSVQALTSQALMARRPHGPAVLVVRVLDLLIASVLLVLLAPLLLALALAIRLNSPGPALFRQRRLGLDGRVFVVNKFRTMRVEADEAVHREYVEKLIGGRAAAVSDGRRSLYKLAVDDRVTPVGHVLRRWSLDELPQLINVICGQMSLVGPRPVIEYEVAQYPDWYYERFAVKPGLTGLWQVSGRSERTYDEMVQLDVEFARRWSVGQYLWVLLRTPWVLLFRRDAA